jgi:hypothetical protein
LKKTTAILFFALFLFNLAGYKCWFYYLQQKEQSSLESRLDKEDYNERDLIRFTVPLNMPYQSSWTDFERVDGEVTINGIIYKYVKRKVEDGKLIVLCLPNYKKMKLAKASSEFGSHGDGVTPPGKRGGSASSEKNGSLNEYEENAKWAMRQQSQTIDKRHTFFILPYLPDCYVASAGKPPELG